MVEKVQNSVYVVIGCPLTYNIETLAITTDAGYDSQLFLFSMFKSSIHGLSYLKMFRIRKVQQELRKNIC